MTSGTFVTSYYDCSELDPVHRKEGIFPVMSASALRATLDILASGVTTRSAAT